MSNLLTIVNHILSRCGQRNITTLASTNTPVTQTVEFLNQVYFEMLQVLKVNHLIKDATFDTVDGTQSYNLLIDADGESILSDSVQNQLTQLTLTEADYSLRLDYDLSKRKEPTHFFRQQDKLFLLPIPDDTYTIGYSYLVKPQRLANDNDVTELPEDWEWVLEQGTQSLLEKFLGESNYRESYLQYRDGLAQIKKNSMLKPFYRMKGYYRGSKS